MPCLQVGAPEGYCEPLERSLKGLTKSVRLGRDLTDCQNLPSHFTNNQSETRENMCLPKITQLRGETLGQEVKSLATRHSAPFTKP